jgi:SAM-dependent methyltransferase
MSSRTTHSLENLLLYDSLQSSARDEIRRKITEGTYQFESVPCCICNGTNFDPLTQVDRCNIKTPVVLCGQCGLIQTNPRMTEDSYARFYQGEYRDLMQGRRSSLESLFESEFSRGAEQFRWLQIKGLLPADCSRLLVLEVGCGSGGILAFFRDQGCRVKGVDLGEIQIEFGRNKHNLDLSLGSIAELDGFKADVIILSHSLEHLPFPKRDLARVKKLLADDGILFIEVPGVKNLRWGYLFDFQLYIQCAHVYHFSLTTLTNLLALNGFERIAGDEVVRAAFRKVQGPGQQEGFVDDSAAVLRYLRWTERFRKVISVVISLPIRFVKWIRRRKLQ